MISWDLDHMKVKNIGDILYPKFIGSIFIKFI